MKHRATQDDPTSLNESFILLVATVFAGFSSFLLTNKSICDSRQKTRNFCTTENDECPQSTTRAQKITTKRALWSVQNERCNSSYRQEIKRQFSESSLGLIATFRKPISVTETESNEQKKKWSKMMTKRRKREKMKNEQKYRNDYVTNGGREWMQSTKTTLWFIAENENKNTFDDGDLCNHRRPSRLSFQCLFMSTGIYLSVVSILLPLLGFSLSLLFRKKNKKKKWKKFIGFFRHLNDTFALYAPSQLHFLFLRLPFFPFDNSQMMTLQFALTAE